VSVVPVLCRHRCFPLGGLWCRCAAIWGADVCILQVPAVDPRSPCCAPAVGLSLSGSRPFAPLHVPGAAPVAESLVIGQVTLPVFLGFAPVVSDGTFARSIHLHLAFSRCGIALPPDGGRRPSFQPLFRPISALLAPRFSIYSKGVDLRTPQLKILPPRRRMSGAAQFVTILTASRSTLT
jgi:hypothetical protein